MVQRPEVGGHQQAGRQLQDQGGLRLQHVEDEAPQGTRGAGAVALEMAGAQLLFGNGGRPALMAHHRLMIANREQACAHLRVQALTAKLH